MISKSWYRARIALLLLAAEKVGAPRNRAAQIAKAQENAGFDAVKEAIGAG